MQICQKIDFFTYEKNNFFTTFLSFFHCFLLFFQSRLHQASFPSNLKPQVCEDIYLPPYRAKRAECAFSTRTGFGGFWSGGFLSGGFWPRTFYSTRRAQRMEGVSSAISWSWTISSSNIRLPTNWKCYNSNKNRWFMFFFFSVLPNFLSFFTCTLWRFGDRILLSVWLIFHRFQVFNVDTTFYQHTKRF